MTSKAHAYPTDIQIKRAYLDADAADGYRVLIDRLWPRGRSKDVLALDAWLPDIAPSTELRKAFHEARDDWETFHTRYEGELHSDAQRQRMVDLLDAAAGKRLTLVYGAKDETRNHAHVLQACLEQVMHGRGRANRD